MEGGASTSWSLIIVRQETSRHFNYESDIDICILQTMKFL